MPNFTLRLNDSELKELQAEAAAKNQTMHEYILSSTLPSRAAVIGTGLTLQKVVETALQRPSGSEFSIPALFPISIWVAFVPSEKRIVGRAFFKSVNDANNPLSKEFAFITKSSNVAIYKRL